MPGRDDRDRNRRDRSGEDDPITERLIDEGDRSPRAIPAAAREAFDEDQRDPDSPTSIKRDLVAERGIEDPAHSRGSHPGSSPRSAGHARDETHANRDRSDIKGSPRRPAEQTGERGSGRSAANPPVEERNTRSKQSGA